jgi:hypothetical protein
MGRALVNPLAKAATPSWGILEIPGIQKLTG